MKKGVLFGVVCAALLFISTFAACSSNDEPVADNLEDTIMSSGGFDGFMVSVDSLNNIYSLKSRANTVVSHDGVDVSPINARLNRDKLVSFADQVGTYSGMVSAVTLTIVASGASGGTLSNGSVNFKVNEL